MQCALQQPICIYIEWILKPNIKQSTPLNYVFPLSRDCIPIKLTSPLTKARISCAGLDIKTQKKTISHTLCHRPICFGSESLLKFTVHELIPTRNASLVAMQGSARDSNVRYYPTWKHSTLTEMNKTWTCPMFAVRLWITTPLYRWPIGLPSTCMVCPPPALH
jgi:hypothetical protein